jgi:hypothetical protein
MQDMYVLYDMGLTHVLQLFISAVMLYGKNVLAGCGNCIMLHIVPSCQYSS